MATMPPSSSVQITHATPDDVPLLMELIRRLAEYEKLSHRVETTEADLREHLFGSRPAAETVIARVGGGPAGYAMWFQDFSSFVGKPGIYLEDVFVLPDHRGNGVGRALLRQVARVARDRGCRRLAWSVLDWNENAIAFYRRIGADVLPDWRTCRMDEGAIARLAAD